MAKKKKKSTAAKTATVKSFSGVVRGNSQAVQDIANALRTLVLEELEDVEERFYTARRPMAMYRTTGDVCWIQPQMRWCNLYFMRGTDLTDPDELLEGSSDRFKHAKVRSLDDLESLPLRAWLRESIELNSATIGDGLSYEEVLQKMRSICLALPNTKETVTWGMPHFRVGEKIFCGCAEVKGAPRVGLKMERHQSEIMMQLPGICKSPYSRPGDGWVTINTSVFDDWDEIERSLIGSYRLIAPKRTVALLDGKGDTSKRPATQRSAKSPRKGK